MDFLSAELECTKNIVQNMKTTKTAKNDISSSSKRSHPLLHTTHQPFQ